MSEPFRLGIAGLGTVGTGVIKILQQHDDLLTARAGCPIEIAAVSARSKDKKRDIDISSYQWIDDTAALTDSEGLDAVVELIGGEDGVAKDLTEKALARGISVVTANKAMLAHHGYDLAILAEENDAALMYEAAVAGGIPIIKSLREGFAGNEIGAVYGILNGTCNYILTEMRETGRSFSDVLEEAQELGYAEADPTFDIEGIDAGHKLCILSALVFGVKPNFKTLPMQGVSRIAAADITFARELGYRIKLLGISRMLDGKVIQMVEPCMVRKSSTIGAVDGVFNAVYAEGDFVGTSLEVGRGAGEGPTASAVISDIIDLARGFRAPVFGVPAAALRDANWGSPDDLTGQFYIRLSVIDKPGVLADITAIIRDHNVSMGAVLQHGRDPDKPVSIVMTTHEVLQADVKAVIEKIAALEAVREKPSLLRIEEFTH